MNEKDIKMIEKLSRECERLRAEKIRLIIAAEELLETLECNNNLEWENIEEFETLKEEIEKVKE